MATIPMEQKSCPALAMPTPGLLSGLSKLVKKKPQGAVLFQHVGGNGQFDVGTGGFGLFVVIAMDIPPMYVPLLI
jgi:hypothetical protein